MPVLLEREKGVYVRSMPSWRRFGAIQVLRNADGGGGGCPIFRGITLRRCKVQCYLHYEGVGGGPISRKKTLRNT